MTGLLNDPGALELLLSENPAADEDREQLTERAAEIEKALAKITTGQKRLVENLADAEGDLAGIVAEKIRKSEAEKRALRIELDSINRKLLSGTERRENLMDVARRIRGRIGGLIIDERIELLRIFGVRVTADGREGWSGYFGGADTARSPQSSRHSSGLQHPRFRLRASQRESNPVRLATI